MKTFLSLVTIFVFSFGAAAGAAFHTISELRTEHGMVVNLVHMPLRDLAKYDI